MPSSITPPLPISVCILTSGGDARLEKAIKSIVQVTAEVFVGVTDSEPLKLSNDLQKKIKIISLPAVQDFSRSRNLLAAHATQPWILWLDSDEWISQELLKRLPDLVSHTEVQGFALKRSDVFHSKVLKYGETGDLHLVRLVQKDAATFQRPVHEVLEVSGMVVAIDEPIFHDSHPSVASFLVKISQYAQMEAEYRFSQREKFNLWQVLTYPVGKFVLNYLIKRGFLDGWRGVVYAVMMSIHSLAVRVYLYERKHA